MARPQPQIFTGMPAVLFQSSFEGIGKMLVLSRRANESIIIGQDISISILSVRGNCVRIGVKAPPEVSILRHELVDQCDSREQGRSDMWSRVENSDMAMPSTVGDGSSVAMLR